MKQNSEGRIERYKARLVAKGTIKSMTSTIMRSAPVTKMSTIRTLISLVTNERWKLYQLDVKNIFLYSDLLEEVCMEISMGFVINQIVRNVCRLKKNIYID
jgi:Reverse transcriptase (RNA-dependent DNA polymerase)